MRRHWIYCTKRCCKHASRIKNTSIDVKTRKAENCVLHSSRWRSRSRIFSHYWMNFVTLHRCMISEMCQLTVTAASFSSPTKWPAFALPLPETWRWIGNPCFSRRLIILSKHLYIYFLNMCPCTKEYSQPNVKINLKFDCEFIMNLTVCEWDYLFAPFFSAICKNQGQILNS